MAAPAPPRPPSPSSASPSSPCAAATLPRHLHFVLGLAAVCATRRPPPGAKWDTGEADAWLAALARLLEIPRDALPSDVDPKDVTHAVQQETLDAEVGYAMARTLVQAALARREKKGKGKDGEGGAQEKEREKEAPAAAEKQPSEKVQPAQATDAPPPSPSPPGKFASTVNGWWQDVRDLAPAKGEEKEEKTPLPEVRYTSVARAAAHGTLERLGLDAGVLLPRAEADLSATLVAALEETRVDAAREKQKHGWGGSLGRGLAIGAGVITSGVLLGVTGGLAAPAIAAVLAPLGIGALSAAAAPVVIGTLFGLTGGGLAGWRVSERWRGVREFAFIEVGAGSKPTKEEVEDAERRVREGEDVGNAGELLFEAPEEGEEKNAETDEELAARREVVRARRELDAHFAQLSLNAGTKPAAPSPPPDASVAERAQAKTPSLTATIVVPGLMTVSRVEAVSAWRGVCSPTTDTVDEKGLADGRDVFFLRFETDQMLKSGRSIETWVMSKLKTMAATQVVKATVLSAYYVALSLPMSVYTISTLALDNTWMVAQSRATKAGKLLADVLLQRVQGARPVVLVGTSVGALTVLTALLELAERGADAEGIVESVFFVSLPAAPTEAEWAAVRRITARRVVNAWSDKDLVLAGVVRLHEVLSRSVVGANGTCVAGLRAVDRPGVEDVDLSDVLGGHGEINAKLGEVLGVLEIDD